MLDKEGIPTNQNKTWRESAVHYILTNERYIGDSLWQKKLYHRHLPCDPLQEQRRT